MIKLISISMTFIFTLGLASLSNAQTVLFKSNLNYKAGTAKAKPQFFRIPSLVVINKTGDVVAFAEERLGDNDDTGDINIVYRISRDHGQRWGSIKRICELGRDTCGNPTAVVDQNTGIIHLFMNSNDGRLNGSAVGVGGRRVLYTQAVVNGDTLQAKPIKDMTSTLQNSGVVWDAVGPGAGIQIATGKFKNRLIIPARRRIFYSDDSGRTWDQTAYMRGGDTTYVASESAVVELPRGVLFRSDRPVRSVNGRRITSFSGNGGNNFQEISFDDLLPDPSCQGSLLRYSEDEIFSANCAHRDRRKNLTIRMTTNGSKWKSSFKVSDDCGYSSMAKTRDLNLSILWERKSNDSAVLAFPHGPKDLVFQKFKLRTIVGN